MLEKLHIPVPETSHEPLQANRFQMSRLVDCQVYGLGVKF